MPEYDHQLVSDEYYNDELNYQEEIDKLKRASELIENVSINKITNGLLIKFPSNIDYNKIEGTISFKRLSNQKIDFMLPIKLTSSQILLKDENLVAGRWDVKIAWQVGEKTYLFKEKIRY